MKKGTVERERRIDSFDVRHGSFLIKPCGVLPAHKIDGAVMMPDGTFIEIDTIKNAAGKLDFFLCPRCGRRVRFLYLPGFVCRECSHLNYELQQVTKGSFAEMRCIADRIGARPPPQDFFDYLSSEYELKKPRYMRRDRFRRYAQRYELSEAQAIEKGVKVWARCIADGIAAILDEGG